MDSVHLELQYKWQIRRSPAAPGIWFIAGDFDSCKHVSRERLTLIQNSSDPKKQKNKTRKPEKQKTKQNKTKQNRQKTVPC
jgi:Zn-finger nucleic acid-binding protein